jgi:hypothetical protein
MLFYRIEEAIIPGSMKNNPSDQYSTRMPVRLTNHTNSVTSFNTGSLATYHSQSCLLKQNHLKWAVVAYLTENGLSTNMYRSVNLTMPAVPPVKVYGDYRRLLFISGVLYLLPNSVGCPSSPQRSISFKPPGLMQGTF